MRADGAGRAALIEHLNRIVAADIATASFTATRSVLGDARSLSVSK